MACYIYLYSHANRHWGMDNKRNTYYMAHNELFELMTASIEQMVDDRINERLQEIKAEIEDRETAENESCNGEYISIEELSNLTGLSKATIYGKRSRRELPAYKFGRELRFKRSEVENWIRSKRLTVLEA